VLPKIAANERVHVVISDWLLVLISESIWHNRQWGLPHYTNETTC